MRIHSPYAGAGQWFRGSVHVHTVHSAGGLSVEETVTWYQSRHYDFLSITDHNQRTDASQFDSHNFLTIAGTELSDPPLLVIGLTKSVREESLARNRARVIEKSTALGIVPHPYASGLSGADLMGRTDFQALEICSNLCQEKNGKGFSLVQWDELLASGRSVWGVAADDAYFTAAYPNAGKAWLQARAKALTRSQILEALRSGDFYSSTGPSLFEVEVLDNMLRVKCSPVRFIRFIGQGPTGATLQAKQSDTLVEGEYRVSGAERYVRIECVDAEGRTAWSNPVFVETEM